MDERVLIMTAFRSLARRLRLVRAGYLGLRAVVPGLGMAALPLLGKTLFPEPGTALLLAAGLAVGIPILGALYGLLARASQSRVALLADRNLGLGERLTSARELLEEADFNEMARAQLAETAARLRGIRVRAAFRVGLPREAPAALPLGLLAVALAALPGLPLRLPGAELFRGPQTAAVGPSEEKTLEPAQAVTPGHEDPALPKATERDVQHGPEAPHLQQGDLAAIFKDTKVSDRRPDFGSFVRQADDRMKLLAQPNALPDLHRDFTQSPYQVMIRRMQEQLRAGRLQGLSWEQIEKLLSDLRDGQQGTGESGLPDDLLSELEQPGTSPDKMASALNRALNRLREQEAGADRGRGKGLREATGKDGSGDQGEEGGSPEEGGQPGGSKPGKERSLQTRQDPT
ncbi:MAG TPA: hypothetical protein VMG58_16115, partial [Candidatus Sulfotelmatobacter sp.]|nr:hypothetical protein [Candidatus Sulfotelmatobacter sp.]